jgi:hypothetical protein
VVGVGGMVTSVVIAEADAKAADGRSLSKI